ncbi:MAG: DUF4139 domain-containing protein, partial [Phycisphaeraceae bacterium]
RQVPGFAVVRDIRTVDFAQGDQAIDFIDVAAFIDPTTVSLTDLDDGEATAILEQQFLFDLVHPDKLLDRYVDKPVVVRVPAGDGVEEIRGVLLSTVQNQIVLRTDDGIRMVPRGDAQIALPALPDGLITRPTQRWLLRSAEAGERRIRTTYQTDGLTWRADYNLILSEDETSADLHAWVTLLNLSGISYPDAQLKLIAGDVQRVQPQRPQPMMERMQRGGVAAQAEAFEQRAFFEYHLYTLPRRTTINQNTTQQLALFPSVSDIAVERTLVYQPTRNGWIPPRPQLDRGFGQADREHVDVFVRFENSEENNLGMPMPRGIVRAFKADQADDAAGEPTLEFIGEDQIDHTPRNQDVLIRLGRAFDVTATRTQTNFQVDERARTATESIRIELSNAKDEEEQVIIRESLMRTRNWEIIQQSDDFEKIDAHTIEFDVTVPPEGDRTVTYTVRYTW